MTTPTLACWRSNTQGPRQAVGRLEDAVPLELEHDAHLPRRRRRLVVDDRRDRDRVPKEGAWGVDRMGGSPRRGKLDLASRPAPVAGYAADRPAVLLDDGVDAREPEAVPRLCPWS